MITKDSKAQTLRLWSGRASSLFCDKVSQDFKEEQKSISFAKRNS